MIKEEDLYKIGTINKPHGLNGELSFTFQDDLFDRENGDFLFFLLDGIFVPMYIEEYRFKSDSVAIIKFEGIDSIEKAKKFTNINVYYPKSESRDNTQPLHFIGYIVKDTKHGIVGKITNIDINTINTLLEVKNDNGKTYLIPFHEDLIEDITKDTITLIIPEGIIDENINDEII